MKWIDATTNKPPIDIEDEYNNKTETSVRVLAWIEDEDGYIKGYYFVRYIHSKHAKFWSIEGITGAKNSWVKYYSILHPPTN